MLGVAREWHAALANHNESMHAMWLQRAQQQEEAIRTGEIVRLTALWARPEELHSNTQWQTHSFLNDVSACAAAGLIQRLGMSQDCTCRECDSATDRAALYSTSRRFSTGKQGNHNSAERINQWLLKKSVHACARRAALSPIDFSVIT